MSARLSERGLRLDADLPELVVICVPDTAIAEVAGAVEPRPVGGAHLGRDTARRPRSACPPLRPAPAADLHAPARPRAARRRLGRSHGREPEAVAAGTWLAETLGLRPFPLEDAQRALYHAGAAVAANYLVTLRRAAGSLLEAAGAPPEALDPLMRRVIENDFELTGAIERGDWDTVDRHLDAIRADAPHLEETYQALARLTAAQIGAEVTA